MNWLLLYLTQELHVHGSHIIYLQKILDIVDTMQKSLRVNTVSGMTLGTIGIVPLIPDIDNHTFVHNFIIHTKLKQSLIIELDFA